jgi:hypothetical protein
MLYCGTRNRSGNPITGILRGTSNKEYAAPKLAPLDAKDRGEYREIAEAHMGATVTSVAWQGALILISMLFPHFGRCSFGLARSSL